MQPQYLVVQNTDVGKMVDTVNELLGQGYVLVGGLGIGTTKDTEEIYTLYCQALVRMPKVVAQAGIMVPRRDN